jgi:hypothetical protein
MCEAVVTSVVNAGEDTSTCAIRVCRKSKEQKREREKERREEKERKRKREKEKRQREEKRVVYSFIFVFLFNHHTSGYLCSKRRFWRIC